MPDKLSDEVKAMYDEAFFASCAVVYIDEMSPFTPEDYEKLRRYMAEQNAG